MRSILLYLGFGLLITSCKVAEKPSYSTINGNTMGTTYRIICDADRDNSLKSEIDALLIEINKGLSTYEPQSVITLFNTDYESYLSLDKNTVYQYFIDNYQLSEEVYKNSNGAFEPTIMPVVNYWGFGYEGKSKVTKVDSAAIKKLMNHIGFTDLYIEDGRLMKTNDSLELDFSGIAKGYGVDKVAEFLKSQGMKNYYVEIGGEVFTEGVNERGVKWKTGISVPKPNSSTTDFQQIIEISGKGIATSGNYRNYYETEGQTYSHTINPQTGFPERSNLLSTTIIANSCAIADGYATACMVLGLEKSIEMVNLQQGIDAILIYIDDKDELQVYDSTKN